MKTTKPKLTLKIAKQIIKNELGLSATKLIRSKHTSPDAYIYEMQLGKLTLIVENGWFYGDDYFYLNISSSDSYNGQIKKIFNPCTLNEDSIAQENAYKSYERELIEERAN